MSRYKQSELLLTRALRSIPLASQTFSKSLTQYPYGVSPYFIKRGKGSYVWDVDGNEYVDFVNSLAAITLGYDDIDVRNAVLNQLDEGTIFSLPHPIEIEVAEKIIELVPCAESVRFGKNGSDATAGAIRLARAYTNRDHVAVCGYHGWQDWFIGSTPRNRGVPSVVQGLTHSWNYNDINSLEDLFNRESGQIAAVIMEPMNVYEPLPGFLEDVKALTHKHGALLIFDETVTGFRFAKGGAQEYFNVVPDLATFGKGIANGYPLAVVAGTEEVMSLMEEIFFSFTYGGETLSLAAANAVMNKLQHHQVIEKLYIQGEKIIEKLNHFITANNAQDIISVEGNPTWSFVLFNCNDANMQMSVKTLFMQEMLSRGILTLGTHNMSYSHSDDSLAKLFDAYQEIIPILVKGIRENKIESMLNCKPLEPLFKVR